jgi:hypothetical protein
MTAIVRINGGSVVDFEKLRFTIETSQGLPLYSVGDALVQKA